MKKLKEVLQGIAFLFIGIPIMIMASIMDQRAFKKEQDQRQKAQDQSKRLFIKTNQNRGTLVK